MLLSSQEARKFLDQYQTLLADAFGDEPSSLDDWVTGREHLIERLKSGDDFIHSLGLDPEFVDGISKAVYGDFCFLKRYKKYCALQHLDSGVFYGVRSLTSPLEEMIPEYAIITTGIVPYAGAMVCDGLVQSSNMRLGKNYARSMRDGYWEAKRGGSLVLSMSLE